MTTNEKCGTSIGAKVAMQKTCNADLARKQTYFIFLEFFEMCTPTNPIQFANWPLHISQRLGIASLASPTIPSLASTIVSPSLASPIAQLGPTGDTLTVPWKICLWILACSSEDFRKWKSDYKSYGIAVYDFEKERSRRFFQTAEPISTMFSSMLMCKSLLKFFHKVNHRINNLEHVQIVIRVQQPLMIPLSRCLSLMSSQ